MEITNMHKTGPQGVGKSEIFAIPFRGQFIVYAPFKRIAFIGNREFLNALSKSLKGDRSTDDAQKFLDATGVLHADLEIFPKEKINYKPTGAVLFLNNQCNLKCVYCYADSNSFFPEKMDLETALQAIDIVSKNAAEKKLNYFEVSFHGGGEPTLNWEILEKSVIYARKKPVSPLISASTNGYLSCRKRLFIIDNFDGLSLSFDGPADIQNKQRPALRGKESFFKVMKFVNKLDAKSFNYGIRMTVTKESISDLVRMVSFICDETGVKNIQIEPAFPQGRGISEALGSREIGEFIDEF